MKTQQLCYASALVFIFGGLMGYAIAQTQGTRAPGGAAGAAAAGGTTGGDQIVDGIGETSLVARYPLQGNVNDTSRDGHNGTLHGGSFVDDKQFGKVLSLTGDKDVYLELPSGTLTDADTVSVVGWVYLNGNTAGQRFFDFGKSANARFYATTSADGKGYQSRITADGTGYQASATAAAEGQVAAGKWVHLAVVFDPAAKTLTTYADGVKVEQGKNVGVGLDKVIDEKNADANKLYIGRALDGSGGLNAKLHDVRIYSVALSDDQVATIRKNALAGGGTVAAASGDLLQSKDSMSSPIVVATGGVKLTGVADIVAETAVGMMPKLPVMLAGTYANGVKGPTVRVIWPSPKDNKEVLKEGTFVITGSVPGTDFAPKATVTVKGTAADATPKRSLEPFGLGQVVLEKQANGDDSQFIKNRDKFVRTLAATNTDNFLYMFRDAFGEKQPAGARALGGWDTQTTKLRGHASGHYMSALAQAYASASYDPKLQEVFLGKMNYMIDTLYDLSQKSGVPREAGGEAVADSSKVPPGAGRAGYDSTMAVGQERNDYQNWGKGFISAYAPDQFIMLEHGATYGGNANQIWAPYYTLHKILAGLLDCYEVGGNKKALEIATGMGIWVEERLKTVPAATRMAMWNRYIAGEYGGMNEVMARMYRLTKDQRFLEGAKLFDNVAFFYGDANHSAGLADNVDTLRGRHANQHIPQITGALETFRNSQEMPYFRIADNFWDIATDDYMYSIGGVAGGTANAECFTAEPDALWANGFNQGGQNETCATYNMLKLSRQLFMFQPEQAKYMDYYEKALFNDILSSVAADNAGNTYHIPLNPGARKSFGNANMSGFTCCNGTALESNTKLQDSIYFRSENNADLYVNLYVPSTLTWSDKKAVVKQETNFPYADSTKITLTGAGGTDVHVRVPEWAVNGFFVKINGADKQIKAEPGTYISLGKEWKDGATIELKMPFDFHLSRVMDQPNIASIMYGPIVLAAQETTRRQDWHPVALDLADMKKSISGDPSKLEFKAGDAVLKPFYESYGSYSVYVDVKAQ